MTPSELARARAEQLVLQKAYSIKSPMSPNIRALLLRVKACGEPGLHVGLSFERGDNSIRTLNACLSTRLFLVRDGDMLKLTDTGLAALNRAPAPESPDAER